MRNSVMLLVGAAAVGLVGGALLPKDKPTPAVQPAVDDWKPRNTIKPERFATAEDLDSQQPDTTALSQRPRQATSPSTWSYRNCREARAAGAAPLYRGQPGYGPHMDGDNDGIACEPYHR